MLQKPSPKSKARDHVKYLTSRMELWKNGDLKKLMSECNEIQKRIRLSKKREEESKKKAFCRLMLLGKIGQACKFVDHGNTVVGVHSISDKIKQALA